MSTTLCRLRPFTFFGGIVPSGTPLLGGFHVLTVDHTSTGTCSPPGLRARLLPQLVMQLRPPAIPAPQPEIMVNRGPGGQIMRQTALGTPCAQHVQDAIHDFTPGHTAQAATRLEGRHFRLQQLPFFMRQITVVGGSSHRITLRNVGMLCG